MKYNMKRKGLGAGGLLLGLLIVTGSCLAGDAPDMKPHSFNEGWMFTTNATASVKSDEWKAVALPHTAQLAPLLMGDKMWMGECLYRKVFTADQLRVRFCHGQAYGFEAFLAGDDVDFVHADSLRIFDSGRVKKAEMTGERDMLLTLENSTPEGIQVNNIIENVTLTPEVSIRNCKIEMCSKRGFLLATRRKVLIENNTFNRTAMCAILVANDARGGFESGPVRNMTISGNKFVRCGIAIRPENGFAKSEEPVHENIRIEGNVFDQAEITAKSVKRLIIVGNKWLSGPVQVRVKACMDVNNEDKKQEIRMLVE